LLIVVEPNPYPTGMEGAVLVESDAAISKRARQQLPHVARRFVPKSVRVTSLVAHGRAADVIVETAEEKGADLIVLSTHGHTGLDRLMMGSVAEQVVRSAKCPVFVVRKTRGS
jgi:nucleotide-binding universal stress UspA family protein